MSAETRPTKNQRAILQRMADGENLICTEPLRPNLRSRQRDHYRLEGGESIRLNTAESLLRNGWVQRLPRKLGSIQTAHELTERGRKFVR